MGHLVSYKTIEGNLRRTAEEGLISLLNQRQLEDLAFKYFSAIDEKTGLPGYQCPYSGKEYYSYENIVLEHIIPVISKGGTVLFNCIPTSKEVNSLGEKGAKHLIAWWINSKYWDKDAPYRLEKIVNYMLDGYEKVFEEYTIDEIENSYLEIEQDKNILEEQDDLKEYKREEKKLLKQAKDNGIHSYLGFMLDCINTLDTYNIDTTEIKNKLKLLEDKHIFEDINKYQLYQNIVQKIIISRIGDNNSSYLTYTINFDIKKLMDTINLENEQDIYNEINSRLMNIENLLKQNNLSTIEYFKSLRDIQDIDISYKDINNISQKELQVFLENIKLGIDTKIEIFIRMLNQGNSNILKARNKETLQGYPSINLSKFWSRHKGRIKQKLFVELKDDSKYDRARELVTINEISINVDKQIPIFIDMLNQGNSEILKVKNQETLQGYPNIKLSSFWSQHKDRIKQKLFVELKDDSKYDRARELVTINEISITVDKQIPIFIDMLNQGNSNILKARNKETLQGYPSIKLSYFWRNYQDRIKQKLFIKLKDNPKYDKARQLIEINEIENDIYKKIEIFIDMLNQGNSKILKRGNKETLEGYPNIKLSSFWKDNKDPIMQKLFVELKDDSKYDRARELVTINEISINVDKQIPIFIDMLNQGNSNILKQGNKETLKGYPNINLSYFWSTHQKRIKQKLFIELKDNPKYDAARKLVSINEIENNIYKKIEIFIEMLNQGNSNILKQRNQEKLEGYPNIKLSSFWIQHKDPIMQKLFVELKDDSKYDRARELVTINEISINVDKQIPIFIDMLNQGNSNILKQGNKEILEGYSNINLSTFWHRHKDRIKQKLFIELKDNPKYDKARELIAIHEISINVDKQIPIFIDMLNQRNSNILKRGNKETLEGYPSINLSTFWSNNQTRIKQKLFIELKDNPEYNIARQTVLDYFHVKTYEELEVKQNKGKQLKELEKMQQEIISSIEYLDEINLTEEEQRKRA